MKRKFKLAALEAKAPKFMRITPNKRGAEDVEAMQNRFDLLEAFFVMDGRNDTSHPLHHTYTGLFDKYIKN
jgi:hypothetical protein